MKQAQKLQIDYIQAIEEKQLFVGYSNGLVQKLLFMGEEIILKQQTYLPILLKLLQEKSKMEN